MKYAWINFTISSVTSKLIGMRLLKRMIKVRKFSPKLFAPPSILKRKKKDKVSMFVLFRKLPDDLLEAQLAWYFVV